MMMNKTLTRFKKTWIVGSVLFFMTFGAFAQYDFPACETPWDEGSAPYLQGQKVSYEGKNYEAKYYTTTPPGEGGWQLLGACGDGNLGEAYTGEQRIIGYLPTWRDNYDFFNPESVTHVTISFLLFKQNNNDWNSADFASLAFDPFHYQKVDSLLFDLDILAKSHAKNTKVMVALGGATDFAFMWLMQKYYNNDVKINELADLVVAYVHEKGIDGIDLDLEAWWTDPAIQGTTDQGGRVRGDKWGGTDEGAHPAGIGLTKFAKALREKMPDKLLSAAVFGTANYANNYDDEMVQYLDWLGLMTYDFSGSWDKSPYGPHSALYKLPTNTYPHQSADQPLYSVEDALEYWMGLAEPAWNHDGGFSVPRSKLCLGVPAYGYDFAENKPDGGNGFLFVPYREIVETYPNAATSFDPLEPAQLSGHITENGRNIYYDTPKAADAKMKYSQNFGHQGVIVWEMSMDADYQHPASIFRALNEAKGNTGTVNNAPISSIVSPNDGASFEANTDITITATASDSDGSIAAIEFYLDGQKVGETTNAPYEFVATELPVGDHQLRVRAIDNQGATGTSATHIISITGGTTPVDNAPSINFTVPAQEGSIITQATLSAVTLMVSASDDNAISNVIFNVDGQNITAIENEGIYSVLWIPSAFGDFTITATATDNANQTAIASTSVTILQEVSTPTNEVPTVSLSASNTSTEINTNIILTATASDTDGAISFVVFKANGNVIATDDTAPYVISWTPTLPMNYVLEAVATDDDDASATSSSITITATEPNTDGNESCENIPDYQTYPAIYNQGDQVIYNGIIYESQVNSLFNVTPGSGEHWWKTIGSCTGRVEFKLLNNSLTVYPNPATDRSTIQVRLTSASHLNIDLFNALGQKITHVATGHFEAGEHTFRLNNTGLASGIYVLKVNTDGQITTLKMIKK